MFDTGITCVIGRGDSGKSTILDAIDFVFSSSWGIITEGPVKDLPEKLVSQYSAHISGVLQNGDMMIRAPKESVNPRLSNSISSRTTSRETEAYYIVQQTRLTFPRWTLEDILSRSYELREMVASKSDGFDSESSMTISCGYDEWSNVYFSCNI